MSIRKIHRTVGLIFAPFFLITAVTGIALFWRKDSVYSAETKELLIGLHNWELGAKYVGVVLSVALIGLVISGSLIALRKKN